MQRRTLIGLLGSGPTMAALRRADGPERLKHGMPRLIVALAALLPLAAAAKGGPICVDFAPSPVGTHPAAGQVIVMGDIGRAQRLSPATPGRAALRMALDGAVMRVTLDLSNRPAAEGAAPELLAINDRRPGRGDSPPRVSHEPLPSDGEHEPGQRLRIESWAGIRSVTLAVAEPLLQRICVER